jgi:hypothetical protein
MRPRTKSSASRTGLSKGVATIAVILALLHLLNFLNYTFLSGYFDPPLTRSILLISSSLLIMVRSVGHLGPHVTRSWDMYGICVLALISAVFSSDPSRTLMYAMWLTLAVYLGTELSVRVRTPDDVVAALAIVLLPVSFLVVVANLTLGPVIDNTERHFGALGSQHVDTAYAMNFVCFFLAIRAVPAKSASLPAWLVSSMWIILAWAFYQVIFGLTRSVWLGVALTLVLYGFRSKFDVKTLLATLLLAIMAAGLVSFVGIGRLLPEAVKSRMEVTEQRYESGDIDPRVDSMRYGIRTALANPQGTGYATRDSHNSYLNILMQLGWAGFVLALIAIARSALMTWRMGFGWFLFFAIGSAALLLQAFFEVQNTPGQANFMPLLLWYGLSRARFVSGQTKASRVRPKFVEA